MIELVNLVKEYPGASAPAVDDLSLVIGTGETVALLGPSGCGKTSTLNMIVGLERPTSGDILIDGASIVDVPVERRGIGLVFQDYAVFTSMTVRRNLAFGLEVRGAPKERIKSAVGKTAELLGLADRLDAKASKLSGSELQRVAIGRTLVTEPSILLLDEPLSNLEAEARLAMRQELRRLRSELGLTIVYVTHDQVEALSLADRIAVMSYGRLVEAGPTARLVERPGVVEVARFLGSPPMNVIEGNFIEGPGGYTFRKGRTDLRLPPCRLPESVSVGTSHWYHLGVRPEDLRLADHGRALITGRAESLERRGSDAVLQVAAGDFEVKVVAPSSLGLEPGRLVGLEADLGRLFLFGSTGRLLDEGLSVA